MITQNQKYKRKSKFLSVFLKRFNIIRKKSLVLLKRNFNIIIIIIISLLTLGVIFYFINKSFLGEKNSIREVVFQSGSVETFDDPYFYKDIKSSLIGKNYMIVKYFQGGSIKKELKDKYKIIKNISFKNAGVNSIMVEIQFSDPTIIINDGQRNIGVMNGYLFDISSGSSFLNSGTIISITGSSNGFQYLSGIFYKVDEEKLKLQLEQINKFFGNQYIKNMVYIPGGGKIIVTLTDGTIIYINNYKNIADQLNKYYLVSKNYGKFNDIKEIDLGSSDDVIIK